MQRLRIHKRRKSTRMMTEEPISGQRTPRIVTVKNGRATRMIVKPGDKIRIYPEEKIGQKAIGWKVEYLREYNEYDIISGTGLPVHRQWNTGDAKTLFKLVTNGSALEWGCTIPAFSAMSAPGGGQFLL